MTRFHTAGEKTYRKTKIVATLGPSTSSHAAILKLVEAGLDVARLNFSHGDYESHKNLINLIRQVCHETGTRLGVLQDLCGPKIRLGTLPQDHLSLHTGQRVVLFSGEEYTEDKIPINYPHLVEDLTPGAKILLADGLVELTVESIEGDELICTVVNGGEISSRKGANMPLTHLRVSAFTEKDRRDLAFGLEQKVDFVALSFVRNASDLQEIRSILDEQDDPPLLLAKIETPQAIDNLTEILALADGAMVARGDLGVEMPFEELPLMQKKIIAATRSAAKPVITATQMLHSMINSPRPTRAEATDVANAVLDGSSAIMLSDETAVGSYPVESVVALDRIARSAERGLASEKFLDEEESDLVLDVNSAISRAAVYLAKKLNAVAIVATTNSGLTARLVTRFRPEAAIIGMTTELRTAHRLSLFWGVAPLRVGEQYPFEQLDTAAIAAVKELGIGKPGDRIILTAGLQALQMGTTDTTRVLTIPE